MDFKNKTPEEIIRELILQNRGTHNFLQMRDMMDLAKAARIEVPKNIKKPELYDLLLTVYTPRELAETGGVGLLNYHFREKLGLSTREVGQMAKDGLIQETGREQIRVYGRLRHPPLYSVFDYCRLTPEDVERWRKAQIRKKGA